MQTTDLLKKEIEQGPAGTFAPWLFKYLGYKRDYGAPKLSARVNAIESLFTIPRPHIYQNDRIAGSILPLWCEKSEETDYALKIAQNYGDRDFAHNSDHYSPNYGPFVRGGIPGLLARIESSESIHSEPERRHYLAAMKRCVLAMRSLILNYAEEAERLRSAAGYNSEVLTAIRDNCVRIADHSPETFAEALQLVWFSHICFCYEERQAMALGRMDQYLYPFYARDIESGTLTRSAAVELLENVFIKIYEPHVMKGWDDVVNICIGGTDETGACQVNELSYCILEAVKNCKVPGPNLSARVGQSVPNRFLDECLKVIGTGIGYPALMNDEVNIAALRRFGYDEKDLFDYTMVGCIENFITGKQPPWSDNRFDTPRFFEFLFNRGRGICSKSFGVDTGDVSEISSMQEFMKRFETQLRHGAAEYFALFRNDNARYDPKEYEQPFLSCFCDDCIDRARDICDGGSKYPSVHGVALMGVGTVCDALAAVEQRVFVDRTATLGEIREAMLVNFADHEALRSQLLSAPKYGNNDEFADKYAVWFVEFLSELFLQYRTPDGGGVYVAMAANISNVSAGKNISATPDGRLQGEPLSDAASPTYGKDVHGATVTVNSLTKVDYTKVACGTVVNQKFSPSMFEDGKRQKLLALVKVYFQKGGQEMQINATSREILKQAMSEPDRYRDLVVRVSGFSALFVTLDRDVQSDILQRTQQ